MAAPKPFWAVDHENNAPVDARVVDGF